MATTFLQLKRNLIEYIRNVEQKAVKCRREFPAYKKLCATPEATQEFLGVLLGDLNELSHLSQDVSIKKVNIRILEHESMRGPARRSSMEVKEISFFLSQLVELHSSVVEAKKTVETQIEAVRTILSARKTYDRLTGTP